MTEHRTVITPMEADYNRVLAPAKIQKQSLDSILRDIKRDGCDRDVIYPACGAVWMISRMRLCQYGQINIWDTIDYRTYPRAIRKERYIFHTDAFREGELMASFTAVFMAVNAAKRKVIPIEEIEPYWSAPAGQLTVDPPARMDFDCGLERGGSRTVYHSDCDGNRHLTAPAYLTLVCDELGFWGGGTKLMRFAQIDYASEILPGTRVDFMTAEKDGARLLRGYKDDGRLAFSARCVF